ncbi:hypothetical protein ACHQM5_000143 [Ranunculus cassubicifolius]
MATEIEFAPNSFTAEEIFNEFREDRSQIHDMFDINSDFGDSEIKQNAGSNRDNGLGLGFGSGSNNSRIVVDFMDLDPPTFSTNVKKRKIVKKTSEFGEVGKFENHTKSFGMKMMEKMGYRGGGLGKNEQGIVDPIVAELRPKNEGLGFSSGKKVKNVGVIVKKREDVPALVPQRKERQWVDREERRRVRVKEFVRREEEERRSVVEKVIDMRGPQEEEERNCKPMPELRYNINMYVDLTEHDLRKLERELWTQKQNVASYSNERYKLKKNADMQRRQLDIMQNTVDVVERIRQENSLGTLTIESLFHAFVDLKSRYAEEYKLCKLSCIASSFALPLLNNMFQGWDPLQDLSRELKVIMYAMKNLLEEDSDYLSSSATYTQLLMEVVYPAVRKFGTNVWNPQDPEPMLKFLEQWEGLLSPSFHTTILENVVMPKLSQAVESWEPLKESVLIHVWVHPWLPSLGEKLESLYEPIRLKLGNALRAWHPSDRFAYDILSPWKNVFSRSSWENIVVRYIIPKLEKVLHELQVNPPNEKADQISLVTSWASEIPTHHMVRMLEKIFFPKLLQVLYHWLCRNPNVEEVRQWFMGWTALLPHVLLDDKHIQSQLKKGCQMIYLALNGMEVVYPEAMENDEVVTGVRMTKNQQSEVKQKTPVHIQDKASLGLNGRLNMDEDPVMSLKEVIEVYALQHELLFKPKPGRTHDGFQIYGFGNISIYFSVDKLYALSQNGWSLVTLGMLKELHYNSCSKQQYCS